MEPAEVCLLRGWPIVTSLCSLALLSTSCSAATSYEPLSFFLSFFLFTLVKGVISLSLHPSHTELELIISSSNLLRFTLRKQKLSSSYALTLCYWHGKHKTPPFILSLSRVGDIIACVVDQYGDINRELVATCLLTCSNPCVNHSELPAPSSLM